MLPQPRKMPNTILLFVVEAISVISCSYGIFLTYHKNYELSSFIYSRLWFFFGLLSNLFGLVSIIFAQFSGKEYKEDNTVWSHYGLQYHFLFSWLMMTLGYPTLVTHYWLAYTTSHAIHVIESVLHLLLPLMPLISWIKKRTRLVILWTQICTVLATFSHIFITYNTNNMIGLVGALIMFINIWSLSIPTKHKLLGVVSSRESFIVGSSICTYIFAISMPHQKQFNFN